MGDENNMTGNENENNGEQTDRVFRALLEAIPDDACYFNVLVALAHLIEEITITLHEENHEMEDDDEDDDASPFGNLPGTSFSQN